MVLLRDMGLVHALQDLYNWSNRPISQIQPCIRQISHNAPYHNTPFCSRNVHTCAHSATKWSIVGYLYNALWDLWDGSIQLIISQHCWYWCVEKSGILSATALRLKNSCNQCNHCAIRNCVFGCRSIGDWSVTTIPKNRRPVGDGSVTGGRLIANWLEIGCDWSATGWRLVGDELATDYRTNNLLCRCNHE